MVLDGFTVVEQIAGGMCSQVLRAIRNADGLRVVLKCYDTKNKADGMFAHIPSEGSEPILKESYFLKKVQNVGGCVKMVDFFCDNVHDQYVIVLEDLSSLGFVRLTQEIINDNNFLTESTIAWIMRELIHTLQQIHDLNILHCDIKPDNIFIHPTEKRIKLLDFNIATEVIPHQLLLPNSKPIACTPEYAPPEVLIHQHPWTLAGEVWSLGVTAFVLLCKKFPFTDPFSCHRMQPEYPEDLNLTWERGSRDRVHYAEKNASKSKITNTHLSLKAKDFLITCLHKKPQCRPSFQRLAMHAFLFSDQPPGASLGVNSFLMKSHMHVSAQAS